MLAYDAEPANNRIVYVVINFDDSLHEYADRYRDQITQYMSEHPIPDLKVVFDIKPAFASAMF
jgi:hypothetical protein